MRVIGLVLPPASLLRNASLFLDFDGTLVDIADRPEEVVVPPDLPRLLSRIHAQLERRLTIVSGRPAQDVRRLTGLPAAAVAGSHGLELCLPGRTHPAMRPPVLDTALARFVAFASGRPGLQVEDKPFGTALHYRLCPDAGAECLALARTLADELGLMLQTGKMVVELRAPGGDKGSAVHALMALPDRHGTTPLFVGDDDTDEAGFAAVTLLGGAGIAVGERPSATARYALRDVAAVRGWLEQAFAA